MLILPLFKNIDWSRPPFFTLAIIFINTFVYFVIQSQDGRYFDDAVKYYINSDLPAIEYPVYSQYLKKTGQLTKHDQVFLKPVAEYVANKSQRIFYAIQNDNTFLQSLRDGKLTTALGDNLAKWRQQRQYVDKLFDRVSSQSYGYSPAKPSLITSFTHMFLHGSFNHLLGNMIVLFIVGFTVEMILGKLMFLVSYITGGLLAVGFYTIIHSQETATLIGASGAIAGLMGIYAALFGLRKIRFFYFVFVYMGYFTAPALLVLIIWMLNELYQFLSSPDSHIAYMAHLGGLTGGAIIGFAQKRLNQNANLEYMAQPEQETRETSKLAEAVNMVQNMEFEPAKRILKKLLADEPNNMELLQHLYTVTKLSPASEDYHFAVNAILHAGSNSRESLQFAENVFLEYISHAKPAPRLSLKLCFQLGLKFAKANLAETTEKIVKLLLNNTTQRPELPYLIVQLSDCWMRRGNPTKAELYRQLVLKKYPASDAAKHILEKNS